MFNLDLTQLNSNEAIVHKREIVVKTLGQIKGFEKFHTNFIININHILSNNYTDLVFGFENPLFESTDAIPIFGSIPLKIKDWLHSLVITVFVNGTEKVTFTSGDRGAKVFKRLNFQDLQLKFNELKTIVVRLELDYPFKDAKPYNEFQITFSDVVDKKFNLITKNSRAKLKMPYQYNINFRPDNSYWIDTFYSNIIAEFADFKAKKTHKKVLDLVQINEPNLLPLPAWTIRHNLPAINEVNLKIKPFLKEQKIKLTKDLNQNGTLHRSSYDQSNSSRDEYFVDDFLTTNELDRTISKTITAYSEKAIKIPYQYTGEANFVTEILTPYFQANLHQNIDYKSEYKIPNLFKPTLQIVELENGEFETAKAKYNLRFVISISKTKTIINKPDFNIEKYYIDKLRNKPKIKRKKNVQS
ncbi:MHO_1580 family protein [Mycoplasma nasistruthionis]|uniref:Uncharacterized protein n=1 Tax=Mycoplasma nasistruthionis TaxID=353852 RepID=A0A5B7XVJ4_9MOLU|nr:hypothetical protein [Mycoplasma nasistruthionis]QCZ36812.1 hypothetical protein FG904_02235 [Mycoplasma nasistruthionis]